MRAPELTCNACKKRTPLPEMKYSKDGSGLICQDCLNKQIGGVSLKHTVPSMAGTSFAPKKTLEDSKKKVQYTCRGCNFRFSRSLDYRGSKLCPNCGRDSVSYNLPNDANKLLKELDEMDDI